MQTTNNPIKATIAGLFYNRESADKAIAELRTAGFSDDTIEELGAERSQTKSDTGFMGAIGRFFGAESTDETVATGTSRIYDRLIALGLDDDDAMEFEGRLDEGGTLVILHAGKRGMDAVDILRRNGASPAQIEADTAEMPTQASTIAPTNPPAIPASAVAPTPASTVTTKAPLSEQGVQRVQLLKEVLRVNKERVQYGEVQLRKQVVSEQQTFEVPVTREEIVIERHPVAEGETATGTIGDGQTIRVPLSEERVSVDKRNVVSEEVTVGTREVQDTRKIDETVRREELLTDKQNDIASDDRSVPRNAK